MTSSNFIAPGATIGIVGGGQLGQMLGQSAVSMGFQVVTLDPAPAAPASKVGRQIVAPYDDPQALTELAQVSDVLTYEFENVAAGELAEAGGYLPQGTRALEICKDRLQEKQFLEACDVPIAPYREVNDPAQLALATEDLGYPCVLKTTRDGYDGKGQVVLRSSDDLAAAEELLTVPCVLEQWVPFKQEASVIVVGGLDGQYVTFPVGENVHVNNILHTTTVPANISASTENEARSLAAKIAAEIGLVGVMGVELFVTDDGSLFVNELAPRPHNSGHYTIEACDQSQFDLHIRAICGWPLVQPRLHSQALMINILGQDLPDVLAGIPAEPSWNVHLYGKAVAKQDRKMGHITQLSPL